MTYLSERVLQKPILRSRFLSLALITLALIALQAIPARAQWTNGTDINNTNSGNVGIGTATPAALLTLQRDQASGTEIRVTNNNTAGFAGLYLNGGFTQTSGGFVQWNNVTGYNNLFVGTGGAFPLYLGTQNTIRLTVQPNTGNIGIGTTTPQGNLHVYNNSGSRARVMALGQGLNNGEAGTAIDFSTAGNGTLYFSTYRSATGYGNIALQPEGGNIGIGTTSPAELLEIRNTGSNNSNLFIHSTASATIGNTAEIRLGVHSGFTSSISPRIYAFYESTATDATGLRFDTYDLGRRTSMVITGTGNVGIGTSTPNSQSKLDVNGNTNVTGNINATGTITGGNIIARYQDVAEWVPASEQIPAGTVVVLDSTKSDHVIASSRGYDTRVAGVISIQPGITLGDRSDSKVLVATTGRVKVKVDATRSPILVGDLLVTSDVPGLAMKSAPLNLGGVELHRPGTLIGKALEPLTKGTGEILVLLSLQ